MPRPVDRGAYQARHLSLHQRRAGCPTMSRRERGSTRGASKLGRALIRVTKGPKDSAKRPRDRMVRNAGYLWPQKHRGGRPLVLRLIVLRGGTQDVYLLTDVLDPRQLTDDEAATLFGMRWGEEVFYRSCKQAMQRRKLLSRRGGTCLAERNGRCWGFGCWA